MSEFDPEWFDIISVFMHEGEPGQLSVHILKKPYNCIQFFITKEMATSPTFWEDVHELALKKWEERGQKAYHPTPCPNCGATLRNWKRWYHGKAFCGICGATIPNAGKEPLSKRIPLTKGDWSQ